jgi:[ribosomal protein S18]-alanine N-acetyltransferase
MKLFMKEMTEEFAIEILQWKYKSPYDFYNNKLSQEGLEELLHYQYFAVTDQDNILVAFYCIGQAAQVPKGNDFGVYTEDLIDIGLGIRSDLTGLGKGNIFFKFIIESIKDLTKTSAFRLTVAKFNKRAIRLYEKFGFVKIDEFYTIRAEFITMVKKVLNQQNRN